MKTYEQFMEEIEKEIERENTLKERIKTKVIITLEKIKYTIYGTINYFKNIIKYRKFLYNDEDDDFIYLLNIMQNKMYNMKRFFEVFDESKEVESLDKCINLIDCIIEDSKDEYKEELFKIMNENLYKWWY